MYSHFPKATWIGFYATARKQRGQAGAHTSINSAISVPASAELVPAQRRPWDELFLESLAGARLDYASVPRIAGSRAVVVKQYTRQQYN